MLDYRVKTFLTLYKEMNYRKTAELLNMTQPGVTQHIHFLENYYGVKLFQWSGKALRRTYEADRLKMYLEGIVADERVLFRDFLTQDRVQLDVGVTKTIGDYVINSEIIDFIRNTDHNINLIIDNTENLLEKIENAELDFAIIEGVFDKQRYKHRLFKKESFVGVCSVDHRFANKTVSVVPAVVGTAIIGVHLFFVGATPSRLLTSANSGFSIIIPIALAVSIEEPPPIATMQSALLSLKASTPL